MMERSLRIKGWFQLRLIVCVHDQAIYAKVHQIKYKKPAKFKDMLLMMSTFHIILSFLAVIATRFKDAGSQDIAIQSNIVAEGLVDTTFSGTRGYKCVVRVYKKYTRPSSEFFWKISKTQIMIQQVQCGST